MRLILTFSLCLIGILAQAQKPTFKPKWDVGTKKTIYMETTETTFEDGVLVSDTVYLNEGSIEVTDENAKTFTIKAIFENQALRATRSFYDRIDEELPLYKNIEMIFSVNKKTAETELLNWEESQKFILESFEQVDAVFKEKAPESAMFVDLIFTPLKTAFQSKETTEAYAADYLKAVFAPFNKSLELSVPLTIEQSGENPMNPSMEVHCTEIFTLDEMDKETGICKLSHTIDFDFSQFIDMMKDLMEQMSEAVELDEDTKARQEEELDSFEMEVSNEEIIIYNSNSCWVEKTIGMSTVVTTDPSDGVTTKVTVESITTIN